MNSKQPARIKAAIKRAARPVKSEPKKRRKRKSKDRPGLAFELDVADYLKHAYRHVK